LQVEVVAVAAAAAIVVLAVTAVAAAIELWPCASCVLETDALKLLEAELWVQQEMETTMTVAKRMASEVVVVVVVASLQLVLLLALAQKALSRECRGS
jgi:hypothetical protein